MSGTKFRTFHHLYAFYIGMERKTRKIHLILIDKCHAADIHKSGQDYQLNYFTKKGIAYVKMYVLKNEVFNE
jgi:hypothetical protein